MQQSPDLDAAAMALAEKLLRKPADAPAWHDLGLLRMDQRRVKEALECFRQAVLLDPRHAEAWLRLGACAGALSYLADAESAYRRALALTPRLPSAHAGLAQVLLRMGRIEDAMEQDRLAVEAAPDPAVAQSSVLLAWNSSDRVSPPQVYEAHRRWGIALEARIAPLPQRSIDRRKPRLRIGYLSPDFRDHSVWKWLEPIFCHHNRDRFDVVAYSDVTIPDSCTAISRELATHWRDIHDMDVESAARLIQRDQIDILVDLAGHTSDLLQVMAYRPAPIQVSYLGYPNTTGLIRIDHLITDPHVDPPGKTEQYHTERLVRLPRCFSCYRPPPDAPAVGEGPAARNRWVTFGSFNSASKFSDITLGLWAAVLKAAPGSRLLLKPSVRLDPRTRQEVIGRFLPLGIAPDRIEMLEREASAEAHLMQYRQVDIALDTFPYHGTTTTCDALWMGVPVVTLAGPTHPSRVGVSLLKNVGLEELIAETPQEYVQIATKLASEAPKLSKWRRELREMMAESGLIDGRRFASELEEAYERMWRGEIAP